MSEEQSCCNAMFIFVQTAVAGTSLIRRAAERLGFSQAEKEGGEIM
jgi:hypothetical protein